MMRPGLNSSGVMLRHGAGDVAGPLLAVARHHDLRQVDRLRGHREVHHDAIWPPVTVTGRVAGAYPSIRARSVAAPAGTRGDDVAAVRLVMAPAGAHRDRDPRQRLLRRLVDDAPADGARGLLGAERRNPGNGQERTDDHTESSHTHLLTQWNFERPGRSPARSNGRTRVTGPRGRHQRAEHSRCPGECARHCAGVARTRTPRWS